MVATVLQKELYLDVSTQCFHTDSKQQLPCLALNLQLLLDAEKPIMKMNSKTSQNLFLCDFHRLGMSFCRTVRAQSRAMNVYE